LKLLYQLGFVCFFDFYFWIRVTVWLSLPSLICTFTDSSADTKAYTAYDTKAKTYRHMNFFEHDSNTSSI
jgi:hypothetical protein